MRKTGLVWKLPLPIYTLGFSKNCCPHYYPSRDQNKMNGPNCPNQRKIQSIFKTYRVWSTTIVQNFKSGYYTRDEHPLIWETLISKIWRLERAIVPQEATALQWLCKGTQILVQDEAKHIKPHTDAFTPRLWSIAVSAWRPVQTWLPKLGQLNGHINLGHAQLKCSQKAGRNQPWERLWQQAPVERHQCS